MFYVIRILHINNIYKIYKSVIYFTRIILYTYNLYIFYIKNTYPQYIFYTCALFSYNIYIFLYTKYVFYIYKICLAILAVYNIYNNKSGEAIIIITQTSKMINLVYKNV